MLSVVYVLPSSRLHGGIRVVFDHAEELQARGHEVTVVGPDAPPSWHPVRVPYRRIDLDEPTTIPAAEVCIGTFWTTVMPAVRSRAERVLHLCQGFEGVHPEYAPILDRIDEVYELPVPKLLISRHLEPLLVERYGCECHYLGPCIDSELFSPDPDGTRRREGGGPDGLTLGVVGPWSAASKGIAVALRGVEEARSRGTVIQVHRASPEPLQPGEAATGVVDHFAERLSTLEMVDFYRGLDALVYSSFDREGFPLPPLEAMACAVPTVLTRIRSFDSIPDHCALWYEAGDVAALAERIGRLEEARLRTELAARGRRFARTLTVARVIDRLEEIISFESASTTAAPRVG